MDFYDRLGHPALFIDEAGTIYAWSGSPLGFRIGENLYRTNGAFAAHLHQGWVRDRMGHAVLFTVEIVGGPVPPLRSVAPIRGVAGVPPPRGLPAIPPLRAVPLLDWSRLGCSDLFGFPAH